MPTLYNGCGTRYAGRANESSRQGECPFCGHRVMLRSYDTRLWIAFVFVPVIPLKRMRILAECGTCHRHYAAELKSYERRRQLAVSEALADYRKEPSAGQAISAHQQMEALFESEQAERFLTELRGVFAGDAKVHAYLAGLHIDYGRLEQAEREVAEAVRQRPGLPEARLVKARLCLHQGKLDEAREAAAFLEKPGASQLYNMGLLESIAVNYQGSGAHGKALELFQRLLDELPGIGQVDGFRKMVAVSEKFLGRKKDASILPAKVFNMERTLDSPAGKRWAWAAVAVVVALGFVARSLGISRHRTVHVVNGYTEPVTVRLAGQPDVNAPPGVSTFTLAEGDWTADLSGPVTESVPMSLHTAFTERWTRDPVWVLNPGGRSVIVRREVTVYRGKQEPDRREDYFTDSFRAFPDVNCIFRDFPEKVEIDKHDRSVTLNQVTVENVPLAGLARHYLENGERSRALLISVAGLRRDPRDCGCFAVWLQAAREWKPDTGLTAVGLARRPVDVRWHRTWQDTLREAGQGGGLQAWYDHAVAAEPDNGALLYLRGRLEEQGGDWFARAAAADPALAWPHHALAYAAMERADMETARVEARRAAELDPDGMEFLASLAQYEYAPGGNGVRAMEVWRVVAASDSESAPGALIMLAGALAQHGRPAEGRALAQDLERAGKSTLSALCLSNVMYNSAEWARARDQVNNEPAGRLWKLHAILGLPDLKRAETVAREGARLTQDPEESLAIALAADLAGDTDRRNAWTAAAASAWVKSGDPDSRAAAAWLEAVDPPDPDLMAQGHLPTAARALLLCHAARRWPEKRDAYAPLALVFSSAPMPPCQLVRALLQP